LIEHYQRKRSVYQKAASSANWISDWISCNYDSVMELLPSVWTHEDNINTQELGKKLRELGLNLNENIEGKVIISFFENLDFLSRKNGFLLIRTENLLFKPE